MLDPQLVTKLVEDQITKLVTDQVLEVFDSNEWLKPIEDKIIQYTQDRILGKFNNGGAVPELVATVKSSVDELFQAGKIPGIEQYVDSNLIRQQIDQASERTVQLAIEELVQDPQWIEKIEAQVNHNMIQRTVAGLSAIDVKLVIKQRVEELMTDFEPRIVEQLTKPCILDLAQQTELTVMDNEVVVENTMTARTLNIIESATIKDLAVIGSINTDNYAWNELRDNITQKTLDKLSAEWRDQLVADVSNQIQKNGINFSEVKIAGHALVSGNSLSHAITASNLQSLGTLKELKVDGMTSLAKTVTVNNRRLGINTENPEMALSVWDEEVTVIAGKFKQDVAYLGTGRLQNLVIGVNRDNTITLDTDGVTTIKKLRVGRHQISHGTDIPNYSGTRGDIVFNANPDINNNVLGWQCLGGFKWKILRVAE